MKTLNLIQGTPQWAATRAQHFCASEAPAMMGVSKFTSRADLLRQKATGIAPEVSAAKQALFDRGHATEASARTIVDELIGDDLSAVTALSDCGKYLASLDGLTLMGDTVFEHKLWSEALAAQVRSGILDMHYVWQLEHQLMVTGAERAIFVTSDGTREKFVSMEYRAIPGRSEQLIAGWKQFAIDLAAYVPQAMTVEVVGRTPETLPALHIVLKGEVSASNLAEFKEVALAAIRSVNRDLRTDQDFADSAKARKWCEDIEARVAAAKEHALGQTVSIDLLFRTMDEVSAEARDVRLALEKLEKARKESRRGEIVAGGVAALHEHVAAMNTRLGKPYMPTIGADFGGAIKGLRTFDSMQNAVDTELARAKIEASATADKIDANLKTLRELASEHAFLFADEAQIVLKAPDDLTMLVKSRIADHKAAEEKKEAETRQRIRAEEQAKAEKAAREVVEREQREAAAAELAAAKQAPAGAELSPAAQALNEAEGAQRFTATHRKLYVPANVVPMRHAQPAAPSTPPTLTLGAIGTRLGFNLSAEFLKNLGFEATKVKASCLYHTEDFPLICAKLVAHIQGVQAKQAA